MGWVKERAGREGRVQYTAVYRDMQGRERSAGTFSSDKKAVAAWHAAEAAMAAGRVGDPARGRQVLRRYVQDEWFPNHVLEATTREKYTYLLDKYILPELGGMRMIEILPGNVREWVTRLQDVHGAKPPTIKAAKVVLDAIFTTALNDQVTFLHAGRGVKTPPVPKKPKRIITVQQYEAIHGALPDEVMRLLVETDAESGLRWGELTELRVRDIDLASGLLTVARVVVELKAKARPDGVRFVVKNYPKDKEWRQLKLPPRVVTKLKTYVAERQLRPGDLLFPMPHPTQPRRRRPAVLPDPASLGMTDPNANGKQYPHGTLTAYTLGACRCRHCKDAMAAYRAGRRASGKDNPSPPRSVDTDGHISGDWFRKQVWAPALKAAGLGFHVTPHGLRHAHASWLLAGGADLQVVKERLGHGSITTTEKYLHTLPDAHDAALDALEAMHGQRRDGDNDRDAANAGHTDPRDVELAEMRGMVAKLSQMLGALDSTA